MAWQDDTPFEAIESQWGLNEQAVIALIRASLKARSFRVWRMRVRARPTKHQARQASEHLERTLSASRLVLNQTLSEVAQEEFPAPPSALTRQSLR